MLCLAALTAAGAHAQVEFDPAKKLATAEYVIRSLYADSVNMEKVVEQGIVGMLKELDPHSLYTNAEETKALTEPLNGNFSGIGVQFQLVQDTVYVIQTVASGPSEKVGIIPGDRIISANDTVIAGRKLANSQIMKQLRGPKGSWVNLKVVRRSEPDTLVFRVKRDDIPLYTVDASYMAAPSVGYIRISSFGQTTTDEFNKAVKELKAQGMKDLIIDLQDNGGGYMQPAIDIAQTFLNPGEMIVYTEGLRQPAQYFPARGGGKRLDGRVVVVLNEYSASASEILAGALQDNDRAAIVGRRSFGKGLVQRPIPFPDGSMIRLTTAHYYTPSGRSIQKPYNKGNDDSYRNDLKDRYDHGEIFSADSMRIDSTKVYHTRLGRTVYGGGGIIPDRFVAADTTGINKYFRNVRAKNAINQYVVDYVETHRKELNRRYPSEKAFIEKFEVTPEMMADFADMAAKLGAEGTAEQQAEAAPLLEANIKGLIGRDLFTPATYFQILNPITPTYREALRLILDQKDYDSIFN